MRNREPQREFCANNCGARLRREHVNFCSNDCKLIAYRVWLIATWKAGKLPPMQYFNRIIREYLLHTLGEHCQRCGWNERNPFTGKIPLEIEHIDGNWQNIAPDNLTILCPNCHSLTATFRGLNRGSGRPGRPGTASVKAPRRDRFREPMGPPGISYLPDTFTRSN
jgi:hypothetical protein